MRRRGTESNEAEPSDSTKNGKKSTEKKVFLFSSVEIFLENQRSVMRVAMRV